MNGDKVLSVDPGSGAYINGYIGYIYTTTGWQPFGSVGGVLNGTGSPEGSISAKIGTLYVDSSGGAGVTLYVKETGTGNTGWAAK